ncbi:hypothetical protein RJD24_06170 [Bacillaceae bacterium IKA-2]|jgi:hypothetical protein|nr:hypothetical protein RJD24_06170 [Bacillaceae bacterium IKA-2]
MEGIYFYWICWICWIYTTFLLAKTKQRLVITIFLLFLIILSTKHLTFFTLTLNSAILFCFLSGCLIISQRRWSFILYCLSVSLISTSAFVTFRLFQLYDPVWVIFNPTWKLSMILLFLILLLVRDQKIRVGLLLITVAQGEILYRIFLNRVVTEITFSQFETLDIIAITIGMSYVWFGFENFVKWLETYTIQKSIFMRQNG